MDLGILVLASIYFSIIVKQKIYIHNIGSSMASIPVYFCGIKPAKVRILYILYFLYFECKKIVFVCDITNLKKTCITIHVKCDSQNNT